ncbi:twin-arginine translocase subunit TatC [Mucilaginibacter sp. X5P1]|uniref:twin-arginine translocase subunit TatC n=1 Tax=Mucilaginibacter sp. X5P1 TaxID=2723088 RepID=UPI001617DD12|nr:twin-arginine translocase subunit TatC [Mucilaginibacter sp. X5P1]MBB6139589.1 sec-independent protein translocase protein TatC [Mucilaginibacter sp. X5P1]
MSDGKNIIKAIKEKGNNLEAEMSFFDHLETLRWHLIRSVIAVAVFSIVAFCNFHFLFSTIIMGPFDPKFWSFRMMCSLGNFFHLSGFCIDKINGNIINTEMAGQFLLQINTSLLIGVIIGIPYILWEIWRFIKPALLEKERKAASGFVFYSSVLFIIGILFGYYILVPESVAFLAGYTVSDVIKNQFTIGSYLSIVSTITLLTGLLFELPIVIYILASIGILTGTFMRKTRRYAIVIIMIVGAIVSPSPDILTTTLATIPLLVLYEVGILVASVVEKRRLKKHEELMAS